MENEIRSHVKTQLWSLCDSFPISMSLEVEDTLQMDVSVLEHQRKDVSLGVSRSDVTSLQCYQTMGLVGKASR